MKRILQTLLCLALLVFLANQAKAQTTVTYTLDNAGYYTTRTNSAGAYTSTGEWRMWANGGGAKEVVSYRNFKTQGDNGGSDRSLQVGDRVDVTVSATAATGHIGFSLNAGNNTTDYSTRNTNSRLYVQVDGTTGSWYVNHNGGNTSLSYNVNTTRRDYEFRIFITSQTTCNVEFYVNGGFHSRLFNLTMNGSAGANISGFSLYLKDDWNGSANSDIYWKQN
ncbi:MAG: hypothetical protein ACOVOV_14195, partial [Dolichospermum sp.]